MRGHHPAGHPRHDIAAAGQPGEGEKQGGQHHCGRRHLRQAVPDNKILVRDLEKEAGRYPGLGEDGRTGPSDQGGEDTGPAGDEGNPAE